LHPRSNFWNTLLNTRTYQHNETNALEKSNQILELVGLSGVKNEYAKNLPHGYQKMLGVVKALAVQPKLLMLDEPLGGMTILAIEHNMQILDLCNHVVVINFGQKIAEGNVEEVRNNPEVIEAYLGEGDAA
jgi:branched-chain amino acid transport system ATP-binding protein